MNSKIGNGGRSSASPECELWLAILAKAALQVWGSEAMTKQPIFKNMGDAGSPKDGDAGAAKNQVLSSFVYKPMADEEN